jgi:response regulator NasT
MLTAFSQRDLIEEARDAGALAYLVKPFDRNDLLPAIEVALGRHREMIALAGEVDGLEAQLEVRRIVDRAKGILMDSCGMKENDAFTWIRSTAMEQRKPMRDIALQVINEGLRP